MNWVYILQSGNGDLYVGVSSNPNRRLLEHNQKRGALFTKNKSQFSLVFLERYENLAEARRREIQIKKWRREKKEMLIDKYSKKQETKITLHGSRCV